MTDSLIKIDQVIGRINTHPEYSDCMRRELKDAMRIEAHRHSALMEAESGEGTTTKEREENSNQSLRRLEYAWNLLGKQGELNVSTISYLGNIISPEKHETKGFRKKNVRFASFEDEIPDWTKVTDRMGNLIMNLPYLRVHPVVRAVGAHIGIVEIHPFMDGNGRCARLLQNFCLSQAGYPPAKIDESEKRVYFSLIEKVLKDRYNNQSTVYNPSQDERIFHEFIESKVLFAAELLESRLRERRDYTIYLGNVENPAIAVTIKNRISSFGRKIISSHNNINIRSNGRGNYQIRIIGDIGQQELQEVMEKLKGKYKIKYDVKLTKC